MSSVDPDGALKMYSQNGEWEKCLELAQQQGPNVLTKYVALYAADLIRKNAALSALQLFVKFGSPATPQNFNIYKHLCVEVFKQPLEGSAGYATYSSLRDMLLSLVEEMSQTEEAGSLHCREFERNLTIAHYMATRAAFLDVEQLKPLVAKLSTSLLRHTDIIPADKAFYESGLHCRDVGWENMAFVFFNRFLDMSEVSGAGEKRCSRLGLS
jgi:intraflagellar transport protein 172